MKLNKIKELLIGQKIYVVDKQLAEFEEKFLNYEVSAIKCGNMKHLIYLNSKGYQQSRYDRLKLKGLCCACGGELDTNGVYCSYCRKLKSINQKNIRKARYKIGVCTNCGDKLTDNDVSPFGEKYKTCKKCRDYFLKIANKKKGEL